MVNDTENAYADIDDTDNNSLSGSQTEPIPEGITLDENDVFYDSEGNIERIYDRETGQSFESDKNIASGDDANVDDAENKDSQKQGSSYVNTLDYVFKSTGIEGDQIDFGDAGLKNIADLSTEEQMEVIVDYIEQLKSNGSNNFEPQNEQETQVIEFLRSGGNLRDFAKQVLENDPATKASTMSDEALVRERIKSEYPEYSEDEVDEELEDLKDRGSLVRQAKVLRARLEKESQADLSALKSKGQAEGVDNALQMKQEAEEIISFASKLSDIDGIKLDNATKNKILNDILPSDLNSNSRLIEDLSNPQALMEISFWRNFGKDMVKKYESFAKSEYERGKKELAEGLPSTPQNNNGTSFRQKSSTNAIDWDKFNANDQF